MVNYPHKISSQKKQVSPSQTKNFANRGMSFEKMINATNDYYLSQGVAVIHKKPTPIQIVRVDYPQRSRAKIVEAYFRQASTTDYSGVYDGYYIDFEAKETRQKYAIPMKNFHPHQIRHMEQVLATWIYSRIWICNRARCFSSDSLSRRYQRTLTRW